METILVVEDDPCVSNAVVEILERHGYTVLIAAGISSALPIVRHGLQVDLVLGDLTVAVGTAELVRTLAGLLPRVRFVSMSVRPFSADELLLVVRLALATGPAGADHSFER